MIEAIACINFAEYFWWWMTQISRSPWLLHIWSLVHTCILGKCWAHSYRMQKQNSKLSWYWDEISKPILLARIIHQSQPSPPIPLLNDKTTRPFNELGLDKITDFSITNSTKASLKCLSASKRVRYWANVVLKCFQCKSLHHESHRVG